MVGFPGGSDSKESACSAGDHVCCLGSEDPLQKGMAPPLQYSCLENPMGRGAPGGGNGTQSSILAWRIPWAEDPLEEGMAPTPVFLPGESHA